MDPGAACGPGLGYQDPRAGAFYAAQAASAFNGPSVVAGRWDAPHQPQCPPENVMGAGQRRIGAESYCSNQLVVRQTEGVTHSSIAFENAAKESTVQKFEAITAVKIGCVANDGIISTTKNQQAATQIAIESIVNQ